MFKNIVVPLDGSATAEVALPVAQGLAQALGARITIVRVVDTSAIARSLAPTATDAIGISTNMSQMLDTIIGAEKADAATYLDKVAGDLWAAGIDVKTDLREGSAGDEILESIGADDVDAAAIATHGRSGIKRTIFGSDADLLVRESGKPIVVVKAK
jgi:nucleotide-binding universal stress UspA family protein